MLSVSGCSKNKSPLKLYIFFCTKELVLWLLLWTANNVILVKVSVGIIFFSVFSQDIAHFFFFCKLIVHVFYYVCVWFFSIACQCYTPAHIFFKDISCFFCKTKIHILRLLFWVIRVFWLLSTNGINSKTLFKGRDLVP